MSPTATPENRASTRVPFEAPVRLRFGDLKEFVTEYAANLSLGGMFVRSGQPHPVGARFEFELSLADDFTLIRGTGEVAWVREREDGPERPAGMGVRFLDVDRTGRDMIFRIVDRHIQRGGRPFDLERG